MKVIKNLPNLNSPKFPLPIFLPTRKFGPTISTPVEELTECRPEYMLLDTLGTPRAPPVPWPAPPPPPPPLGVDDVGTCVAPL